MVQEYSTTISTLEFGYRGGGCMPNAEDNIGIGRVGQWNEILLLQLLFQQLAVGIYSHIQRERWLPDRHRHQCLCVCASCMLYTFVMSWNGRNDECFCQR